ncbi:MAG: FYDLN acid domain-containing protein [Proteobacteria bacterium]|nr:FYDLN acid domain-containing protein [Pseudomonadota bacterium]
MLDKAKLGTRYVCFECGCRFYDLNREVPSCPDCKTDQREAPAEDMRSLLSGRGRPIPKIEEEPAPAPAPEADGDDEDGDDDIEDDAAEEDDEE